MKSKRVLAPAAAALLAAAALPCAGAAHARYSRRGKLEWAFDDITLSNNGAASRSAAWSQLYEMGATGPLFHPGLGRISGDLNFSKGVDINQAVNTSDPSRKVLGYRFSTNLLSAKLRQYLRIDGGLSRAKTTQAWGDPSLPRPIIDDSWSLSGGVSPPGLPSISVSRSRYAQRDVSAPSAVDQRTLNAAQTLAYGKGPLRLRLGRERKTVRDLLGAAQENVSDEKEAVADLNCYDLKRGPAKNLTLHLNFRRLDFGSRGSLARQEDADSNLYLTSKDWTINGWRNHLLYRNTYRRDVSAKNQTVFNSLLLDSRAPLRKGTISNRLDLARTDDLGAKDSVANTLILDQAFARERIRLHLDGGGGWSRVKGSGDLLSDSLVGRLTLAPRRTTSFYFEGRTMGASALKGDPEGSRRHQLEAGSDWRPSPVFDLTTRVYRTRTRIFSTGETTLTDQFTVKTRVSPLRRMDLSAVYDINFTSRRSGRNEDRSLGFQADYRPVSNLAFSARGNYRQDVYDIALAGTYSVGKTRLKVAFEHRDFGTANSYSRLSSSLSRRF